MTRKPNFYVLVNSSTGGAVTGVSAMTLRQAMKHFNRYGQFTGGAFLVNEYNSKGGVKKGLCIQF